MTNTEAAQRIDEAHKAFRDAMGTEHEERMLANLYRVVADVKRVEEARQWAAFQEARR